MACESLSIVYGSPDENELQGITNWRLRERDVDTKILRCQKQPVARRDDFVMDDCQCKTAGKETELTGRIRNLM
jgi:hypothetical protein